MSGAVSYHAGIAAEAAVARLYETGGTPIAARRWRSPAGEIDLIFQERDGTVVFVEVRARTAGLALYGGAAASVGVAKQRRLVFAATHWLMRRTPTPPCRFDVVAIDGDRLEWIRGAFDAP